MYLPLETIKRVEVYKGGLICSLYFRNSAVITQADVVSQSVFLQTKGLNRLDKLFTKGCQFFGCGH